MGHKEEYDDEDDKWWRWKITRPIWMNETQDMTAQYTAP